MNEARQAALNACWELGMRHGLCTVWDRQKHTVYASARFHGVTVDSPALFYSWDVEGEMYAEFLVVRWLVMLGIPAITLAAIYDGTPYPDLTSYHRQWEQERLIRTGSGFFSGL